MKRSLYIAVPFLLAGALAGYAFYSSYNAPGDVTGAQFVSPETLRQWLAADKAIVVDVQTYDGYLQMHFPNSIPTHAYPVATPGQKQAVESVIPAIMKSDKPVVLVCFGGVTGAPNARLHLVSKGVPNRRLFILQGGTWGWPWKNMLESGG